MDILPIKSNLMPNDDPVSLEQDLQIIPDEKINLQDVASLSPEIANSIQPEIKTDELPVQSKAIDYDSITKKEKDQGLLDTAIQGAKEGIIGNLVDDDPTDNYIPLTSQYKTIGEAFGSEEGRDAILKDAIYNTSKFASDIFAPIIGAGIGAAAVGAVGAGTVLAPVIIGALSFGTYNAMSSAAKHKMLGTELGEAAKDVAKETGIGMATGAVLSPVGMLGNLGGRGISNAIVKKLGADASKGIAAKIPVASGILAEEAAGTYLGAKIPANMKGENPTSMDYLNAAITALPQRRIAGFANKKVEQVKSLRNADKHVVLSDGRTDIDYLRDETAKYGIEGDKQIASDIIKEQLSGGVHPDDLKKAFRMEGKEGRLFSEDAALLLDDMVDVHSGKIQENINPQLKPKSALIDLQEKQQHIDTAYDKLTDDDRLNRYDYYRKSVDEYMRFHEKDRLKLIDEALNDPKSDIKLLQTFSHNYGEVKESLLKMNTADALYDNMQKEPRAIIRNIMGLPKKAQNAFQKDLAKNANYMEKSFLGKALNRSIFNAQRVIHKHLGKPVHDYIYRQLDPANAALRQAVKDNHDRLEVWQKQLTKEEQSGVTNYLLELQETAEGGSAVSKRTWEGRDSENKMTFSDLSDKQQQAVKMLLDMNKEIWTKFNQSRVVQGLKPLKGIEGYAPLVAKELGMLEGKGHLVDAEIWSNFENGKKVNKYARKRSDAQSEIMGDIFEAQRRYNQYMLQKAYLEPVSNNVRGLADHLKPFQKNAGEYLEEFAAYISGDKIDATQGKRFLRAITTGTTIGRLAGNLGTYVTQLSSLAPAINEVGFQHIEDAVNRIIADPKILELNRIRSPHLQEGYNDVSIDQVHNYLKYHFQKPDENAGLLKRGFEKGKEGTKWTVDKGMSLIGLMDMGVRNIVWEANYSKLQSEHPQWSKPSLEAEADRLTKMTQGSSSRGYQAPMYRGALGKFLGVLQSFKLNEFHYIVSDVLNLDRPYEYVKMFKAKEHAEATAFAKENKYQLIKLDNGAYAAYHREKMRQQIQGFAKIGQLAGLMAMTNMAFSAGSAITGFPVGSPYADPLDAFWKQKYGIKFSEWIAGQTKHGSNKSEAERNRLAAAAALIELTRIMPFVNGDLGASAGGIYKGSERIGRGMRSGNKYEMIMGTNDLSGVFGNPLSPSVSKLDQFIRSKSKESKAYLAAQNKGTLTEKNKEYHRKAFLQGYFDRMEIDKRKKEAADRRSLRGYSGGGDGDFKSELRRMKREMIPDYKSDLRKMKKELLNR